MLIFAQSCVKIVDSFDWFVVLIGSLLGGGGWGDPAAAFLRGQSSCLEVVRRF